MSLGPFPKFGLIAAISLVLGLLIPGLIAYRDGVFFEDTFQQHIPQQALQQLNAYESRRVALERGVTRIDLALRNANAVNLTPSQLTVLLSLRSSYEAALKAGKPPLVLQPYLEHILMYLWPIRYCCLFTLIVFFSPSGTSFSRRTMLAITPLALGIFVFVVWPLWARNLVELTASQGRIVYAYANFDVDRWSFLVQQCNFAVFAFLLAVIWRQWDDFFRGSSKSNGSSAADFQVVFDPEELNRVYRAFDNWLSSVVILSIGFATFTAVFWSLILRYHDHTYIYEVIAGHVLWFVSVMILIRPLKAIWGQWHYTKMRARSVLLATEQRVDMLEAKLEALKDLQPIGPWRIGTATLTVLSLVAAPIVQALLK